MSYEFFVNYWWENLLIFRNKNEWYFGSCKLRKFVGIGRDFESVNVVMVLV